MTIGDLVRVHWGNCNWEGEEGTDWGYAPAIIVGEYQYTDIRNNPECALINVLLHGKITSFHVQRLEVLSESR